jgi:hypothetical protein
VGTRDVRTQSAGAQSLPFSSYREKIPNSNPPPPPPKTKNCENNCCKQAHANPFSRASSSRNNQQSSSPSSQSPRVSHYQHWSKSRRMTIERTFSSTYQQNQTVSCELKTQILNSKWGPLRTNNYHLHHQHPKRSFVGSFVRSHLCQTAHSLVHTCARSVTDGRTDGRDLGFRTSTDGQTGSGF